MLRRRGQGPVMTSLDLQEAQSPALCSSQALIVMDRNKQLLQAHKCSASSNVNADHLAVEQEYFALGARSR